MGKQTRVLWVKECRLQAATPCMMLYSVMSSSDVYDAWNPGLESELPREYLPLSTVFRSENVSTSAAKAQELSEYCGLPAHELVAFRPARLIVHEVLIHVTTGISVPDEREYEDLGRNFREIAAIILNRYVEPHREELLRAFEQVRADALVVIERELARISSRPTKPPANANVRAGRFRLFGFSKPQAASPALLETPEERELRIVAEWGKQAETSKPPLDAACFDALHRIATGVLTRHGRLFSNAPLLAEIAVILVCNAYGSEVIGEALAPVIKEAVAREGWRFLPPQERPVVMNVKGASAAGKSSMRPLQRALAGKLNFPWEEFALISPDIWRKFLLDYASLGSAYKYAGTLTGHEVEIIDKKLDRRMAARAARGVMPHLLIDRFRFDSFVPELEGKGSNRLLTRFGDLVYMFFMITPPEMTVERAWVRGLKVGRYKAVEDLLAHNIEAYTGMPELFFTWALSAGKRVHYEFLDNSVPLGQPPRTVAYGWNTEMTILDIGRMIDIDRFRKINIHARKSDDVYRDRNLAPEHNVEFLRRCARWIPVINFADYRTGEPYARLQNGKWTWLDEPRFREALREPDARAGLLAMGLDVSAIGTGSAENKPDLALEKKHTLGQWAEALGERATDHVQ
jgi:hypothetical protein